MEILITLLGLAVLVALLYFAISATPIPPALRMIVLIAAALLVLLCLLHTLGCQLPIQL